MEVTYHEGAVSELAHPDIGTPVRTAVRRVRLRRFPYSILYGVGGDTLLVLVVMHHRRGPEHWADR